jgi:D-lactate dehydrogenase
LILGSKFKNMKTKIAFFDTKPYDSTSFDNINKDFGFEFHYHDAQLNKENAALAKGTDVACAFVNATIDAETINILADNGVKLIAMRCAGFNNVDLPTAGKRNIQVVRVPAYSPYAVAEHALALMLTLNRNTHKAYARTRDNHFGLNGLLGFDMNGKTAGIIGTGKIAKILIKTLCAMGVKVLAYDIYPDNDFAKEIGFEYTSLDEIYKKSDIISLHCPLTKETEYIINKDSIAKMKDGVMIINTGRGQLIDTNALIAGLKSGKIGSAGLDVYENEQKYFFEDKSDVIMDDDVLARLLSFNNVLVTAHQAFFTEEALSNIAQTTLGNIRDFVEGKSLVNEVKA